MAKARTQKRQRTRIIVRRARDSLLGDRHGVVSLLIGGLTGFILNTAMVKDSKWIKENWYALPIALLLVGYALWKRRNPHGKTLMALGGYMFMNNYINDAGKEEEKPPAPADTADAGWNWQAPVGQWVITPDGQRVLMPPAQWQRYDAASPALPQRVGGDGVTQFVDEVYAR